MKGEVGEGRHGFLMSLGLGARAFSLRLSAVVADGRIFLTFYIGGYSNTGFVVLGIRNGESLQMINKRKG